MSYVHPDYEHESTEFFKKWEVGQKVQFVNSGDFFSPNGVASQEFEITLIDWTCRIPLFVEGSYTIHFQNGQEFTKTWKGPVYVHEIEKLQPSVTPPGKEYCAALDDPQAWRQSMKKKNDEVLKGYFS